MFEGSYLDDRKHGKIKEYYENGNVKFKGKYENGERKKGQEFDENGNLVFDGEYIDKNKKFGTLYQLGEKVFYGFLDNENHRIEGNQFNQDKTRPFKYNRSALVGAAKEDKAVPGINSQYIQERIFGLLSNSKIAGVLKYKKKFHQTLEAKEPYSYENSPGTNVNSQQPNKSLDESKKNNQNEKK